MGADRVTLRQPRPNQVQTKQKLYGNGGVPQQVGRVEHGCVCQRCRYEAVTGTLVFDCSLVNTSGLLLLRSTFL